MDEISVFTPGRLCLFGEHTDWAADFGLHNGYCLVSGTDQGLRAVVRPAGEFVLSTEVPDLGGGSTGRVRQMRCPWNPAALLEAAKDEDEFFRYCAGVAYQMFSLPQVTGGIEIRIVRMDLPLRRGVSSSAAVCILVAEAFNRIYQLGLFPHELMEVAYLGERLTGSECGRMDQACIYGRIPVLLTFQKSTPVRVEPLFVGAQIPILIVDLAGRKDTIRILHDLQRAYPKEEKLQRALGPLNEQIVRRACMAMKTGDLRQLGELMCQAQQAFDRDVAPLSPEELASPRLHAVLAMKDLAPHVYGGKGVGSQGDGTAQLVARSLADREAAILRIHAAFPGMRCFPLTITPGQDAHLPEVGSQ